MTVQKLCTVIFYNLCTNDRSTLPPDKTNTTLSSGLKYCVVQWYQFIRENFLVVIMAGALILIIQSFMINLLL